MPRGTGGDFRRAFGWDLELNSALERLRTEKTEPFDVGLIEYVDHQGKPESRYFANIASFGVSGMVAHEVNKGSKALGGNLSFVWGTVKAMVKYKDRTVRFAWTAAAGELAITAIAVCNGRYFGSGMCVAPEALTHDGLFDVTIWRDYGAQGLRPQVQGRLQRRPRQLGQDALLPVPHPRGRERRGGLPGDGRRGARQAAVPHHHPAGSHPPQGVARAPPSLGEDCPEGPCPGTQGGCAPRLIARMGFPSISTRERSYGRWIPWGGRESWEERALSSWGASWACGDGGTGEALGRQEARTGALPLTEQDEGDGDWDGDEDDDDKPGSPCEPTAGGPHWLEEGETLSLTVSCVNGNPMKGSAFHLKHLPSGAHYDKETATLRWTPGLAPGRGVRRSP